MIIDMKDMPKGVRLMGIDLGKKTIGIALSDSAQTLATPLQTIRRAKFKEDSQKMATIIKEYEIGGFIFGWPLNMNGSRSAGCDAVQSFIDEMKHHPAIFGDNPPVALWDERLSTQSVDESLYNRVDMKRSSKQKAKDKGLKDSLAAQIILQGALDSTS